MDAEMRGRANGEAGGAVEGGCLIGDQRTDGKKFRRLRGGGGGASGWTCRSTAIAAVPGAEKR